MHAEQRSKLRILLIHAVAGEAGGAETYFIGERKLLREEGYDVYSYAFAVGGGGNDRDYVFDETPNRTVRKAGKFIFEPRVFASLRKFVEGVDPHLIHLHMDSNYPLAILRACSGRPMLRTVHGPAFLCPSSWLVKRDNFEVCEGGAGMKCVRHRCLTPAQLACYAPMLAATNAVRRRNVTTFLAPSEQIAEDLKRQDFGPIRLLRYFVDTDVLPYKEGRDGERILFVGHLGPSKGLSQLLDAMPALCRARPRLELHVAGDGVDLPDHQARAKALGVDEAVKFLGRVPNAAVQALYHQAAVFVMPSLWKEQFGIVGIEALACGTPCAASRLGGIPEWLLDGKHGYLFDPHDPEDIAEKVLRILDDPERAKAFGRNGRAFIEEHYAIDVHRRHLTEIIDDMLVDAGRAG